MTTSGTYPSLSSYDGINIIDLAFADAGLTPQMVEAEHLTVAIQCIRRLQIEWVNRGVNQFMVTEESQSLVVGDESFIAPSGTIDILTAVYRQNGQDVQVSALSRIDYLSINDKTSGGNPLNYFVDKTSLPPTIFLWPVPDQSGLSLVYYRIKLMQDFVNFTNTPDMTILFIDALISGLAYRLASIYGTGREDRLKAQYEEAYAYAFERDGDNASLVLMPRLGGK
jgi:hypothetical protein